MTDKICVLTHNDFDGGACAIILANVYGKDNVEITPLGYKKLRDYVCFFMHRENYKQYKKTFVVDLSFKEEDFKDAFGDELPDNVYFVDHHDTSSHVQGKKNCFWDGSKSAASLLFYLMSKAHLDKIKHLHEFVTLAEDWDLWKKQYPKAEELNFLYFKYWSKAFIKRFFDGSCKLTDSEQIFCDRKKKHIQKIKDDADWILGYDNKLAYTTVPELHHLVADDIYEREPEVICSAIFNSHRKIQSLSLKARPEYLDEHNLSIGTFCEKFGGGGHRHVGAIGNENLKQTSLEIVLKEFVNFLGLT